MSTIEKCSDAHHFPNPSEHSTENCYCGDSYLQTSSYCMSQIWIIGLALGSAIILLVFLLIVIICLAVSRSKLKGKQNGDDEKGSLVESASVTSMKEELSMTEEYKNDIASEKNNDPQLNVNRLSILPDHYEPLPGELVEPETLKMQSVTGNNTDTADTTDNDYVNQQSIHNEALEEDAYDDVGVQIRPSLSGDGGAEENLQRGNPRDDSHVEDILKSEAALNFSPSLENVATDIDCSIKRPTVTMHPEGINDDASKLRQKRTQGVPNGYRASGAYIYSV